MKVFIDCGTNLCQGLTAHINKYNINRDWAVHSFEANPYTFNHAKNIIEQYYSHLNIHLHNAAVWTENEYKKLNVEYQELNGIKELLHRQGFSSDGLDFYSEESLWVGGASNILGEEFTPVEEMNPLKYAVEEVQCIDFSHFLEYNFKDTDDIFIKMDIEGAEYDVLTKLLRSPAIKMIREISIEWHNRMLKTKYDQNYITSQLVTKGIVINTWH